MNQCIRDLMNADPKGSIPQISRLFDFLTDVERNFWDLSQGMDARVFTEIQPKTNTFPKVNVIDLGENYRLEIALAGFSKDDIKLELKDNCLFIFAEKQTSDKCECSDSCCNCGCGGNYLMREISKRNFRRAIRFPEKVDVANITSEFEDGIITCTLAKVQLEKVDNAVKIEIK